MPDTQYGRLLAHSYSPIVGWALHLDFGPYQFPWKGTGSTHFSANSYDRHVPLELYGAAFIPGTYHGVVAPVDIAAAFSPRPCDQTARSPVPTSELPLRAEPSCR